MSTRNPNPGTLYLAGPMAGHAEHNFPAFHEADRALVEAGYRVLSPARGTYGEWSWAEYLRRDLRMVLDADAVAVLPGWESSRGARLEVQTAHGLGMDVRTVNGWIPLVGGHTIDALPVAPTTNEVKAWLVATFGPERNTVEQGLVLAEEVGEVCRAIAKRAQGVRLSHDEWSERIREEIADVVIAATAIAATEGFDRDAVVAKRWAGLVSRDSVAHRPPAA